MHTNININKWAEFLNYSFDVSDYFSIKVNDWSDKKYHDNIIEDLKQWEINDIQITSKNGCNLVWNDYMVLYFECNYFTKKIVKCKNDFKSFYNTFYPDDFSFFKNNIIWSSHILHDNIFFVNNNIPELTHELIDKKILYY